MFIKKYINLLSIDNSSINSLANRNKKNQERQPPHRYRHYNSNQLPHATTKHLTPCMQKAEYDYFNNTLTKLRTPSVLQNRHNKNINSNFAATIDGLRQDALNVAKRNKVYRLVQNSPAEPAGAISGKIVTVSPALDYQYNNACVK